MFSLKRKIITTLFYSILVIGSLNAHGDEVDRILLDVMEKRQVPGLQLAVIKGDKIIKQSHYGYAEMTYKTPVSANTLFTINSITKAFTGVALMQLVEKGKVNLDAPIGRYLTELPEEWRNITIMQLMSHTSGLPNILNNDNAKPVIQGSEQQLLAHVKGLPTEFTPGSKFSYNQTNYVLIGQVMERVSGKPFTRLLQQQFQQIALPRTALAGFAHSQDVIPDRANNYTHFVTGELTHLIEEFSPMLRTAAGMSSTATELAYWLIHLKDGQFFERPKTLETLWQPYVLKNGSTAGFGGRFNGYAIGWPIVDRQKLAAKGAIGGGRAAMFYYPEEDIGVIILSNLQGAFPEQIVDHIAAIYSDN